MGAEHLDLPIAGMTCASCANRIERKLNKLDGVTATVNYATEKARVEFDPGAVAPEQLVAAVEAVGYQASLPAETAEEDAEQLIEELDEELAYESTVWIDGLDRIHRNRRINFCVDLSATPYYLARAGEDTNRIFPWVVSDFGLTDAIEAGLVKTPRVVIRDDALPDASSTSTARTPGTSPTSSRTDSTQCAQVMPWTVYSRLSVPVAIGRKGSIPPRGTREPSND